MNNKRRRARHRGVGNNSQKSCEQIENEVRTQIRVIIHQYRKLKQPLQSIAEHTDDPVNPKRYRIQGADSPEIIQDEVLDFAGSVWQLKDRLKKYFETSRADLRSADGRRCRPSDIEEEAKKSPHLMVCADLWNDEKHGQHTNRSGHSPKLNGVQLHHVNALHYDGAAKRGAFFTTGPMQVPYTVEIRDGTFQNSLGHAVHLIVTAFHFWIPMLRQLPLLSSKLPESAFILTAFDEVAADVKKINEAAECSPA